jgi:hypothetical protein
MPKDFWEVLVDMMRLESYAEASDLNFDDPTPEEMAEQQRLADEIYLAEQNEALGIKRDYDYAQRNLTTSTNCKTVYQKANWLEGLGYFHVKVRGESRGISFIEAITTDHSRNIHAMFARERSKLEKMKADTKPQSSK